MQAAAQRADVNRQIYAVEVDEAEREYQLKRAAFVEESNVQHLRASVRKQVLDEIKNMEVQHAADMQVLQAQTGAKAVKDQNATADAIRAKWQGILQPIAQAWGQSLEKMITSAGSLRDMLANVGQAILQQAIGWIEKIGVRFIIGEQTKTAAAAAGAAEREGIEASSATTSIMTSAIAAIKQIAHSAAVAAARAYAAIAQIPIVGPILAPAAAAAALAGVIALGKTVFSAEGGMDNVPADGTIISAHKQEMVLSAPYANVIRGLAGFAAGGGFAIPATPSFGLPAGIASPFAARLVGAGGAMAPTGDGGGGGDVHHHHNWNISALDGASVRSMVMRNPSIFADAVDHAHRHGWRPTKSR